MFTPTLRWLPVCPTALATVEGWAPRCKHVLVRCAAVRGGEHVERNTGSPCHDVDPNASLTASLVNSVQLLEHGHLGCRDRRSRAALQVGQPLPHGGRVQDAGAGQRLVDSSGFCGFHDAAGRRASCCRHQFFQSVTL